MKRNIIILTIVAFISSLAIGAVSAQDDEQRQNRNGAGIMSELIAVIEEATGLTRQEFMQAVRDGATPAEVITANGGDVAAVTDQAVTAITERVEEAVANGNMTQERADRVLENLESNITDLLNGDLNNRLRDRMQERRGNRGGDRIPRELLEVIIAETGLTSFELRDALEDSTIAEVLEANGAAVQTVIDRAVGLVSQRLSEAVENGRITQEQADERLQRFEERITEWLTGEGDAESTPEAST